MEIRPKARYVRFKIIESKQANNIQINEIEFFDASSSKIVPFTEFNHLILNKPVFLRISYDSFDLLNAGVDPLMSKNMRIFSWISHIFMIFEKIMEIHNFLWISHFGVAEPSRNLPRPYVYKGFSPRGRRGTHFSKIL